MRSEEEIQQQIDVAEQTAHSASRWPGMSYEQGVSQALRWALEEDDSAPMEDD